MSAKDTIVKVLQKNTRYVTQDDISSSPFVKTPEAIFEEDISDTAQQILDSLPKLDKKEVKKLAIKLLVDKYSPAGYSEKDIDEIVDQICSLIPEHKWVQTTDDKGNVIVPLGEVVATGEVKDDAFEYAGGYKIGGKDIDSFFYEHHNQSGTLVWVPDKEDK